MNYLDRVLPQLPQDKANHALYGVFWGLLGAFIAYVFGGSLFAGALIIAALAGVAKEIYDYFTGGDVDPFDALATACGGIPVALATLMN